MIKIKLFGILIVSIAFTLFLGFNSPNDASLLTYIVMFLMVYVTSFLLIKIVIDLAYGQVKRKIRLFAGLVLAFTPTILLALSSLSDISIIDVVFAFGVPAIIVWYAIKINTVK